MNMSYSKKFFYVIYTLIKKEQKLSDEDIFLGPILKTKKESLFYYVHLLNINESIMEKAPKTKKECLNIQSSWLLSRIKDIK